MNTPNQKSITIRLPITDYIRLRRLLNAKGIKNPGTWLKSVLYSELNVFEQINGKGNDN